MPSRKAFRDLFQHAMARTSEQAGHVDLLSNEKVSSNNFPLWTCTYIRSASSLRIAGIGGIIQYLNSFLNLLETLLCTTTCTFRTKVARQKHDSYTTCHKNLLVRHHEASKQLLDLEGDHEEIGVEPAYRDHDD